jgi:hypothetical protein
MKINLQIEITEDEIRSAIADRNRVTDPDCYTEEQAKSPWKAEIELLVKDLMAEVELKLRTQLAATLKDIKH